jgi:hypothetical protein
MMMPFNCSYRNKNEEGERERDVFAKSTSARFLVEFRQHVNDAHSRPQHPSPYGTRIF